MRRRFKSETGFSLTKTTKDIARNRRFQKPSETRKAKRVRFDDAQADGDASSPRCGGPKTSEYAYFRKVKDGAIDGQFRPLHKGNEEQLMSSKISNLLRGANEDSEKLDPGIKDLNFSISGESSGPSGHKLFVSPPISRYDESNKTRSKEPIHKTIQRPSLLSETSTPVGKSLFSSVQNRATNKSGLDFPCPENQCIEKGIFSEKRKRLYNWVAHTTSSDVEKLHKKGSDLVSFLMCRLIPKGNENNDKLKENADSSSKELAIHESDDVENGPPFSYKRNPHKELPTNPTERSSEMVPKDGNSFDFGFPSNNAKEGDLENIVDRSGRSNEIVLRDRDSFPSGFPSNHYKESDLQSKTKDPDEHSNSRICNSTNTQHCYSFSLPLERSLGAFHYKDLDEFGPMIGDGRDGPSRRSLEWDFEVGKGRVHLGKRQDVCREPAMCREPANTWNFDRQATVDDVIDTKGFYPSPLFSSRCLFKPLPKYVPTGCLMHDIQPKLDDMMHEMVEPGQFSLFFPSSPKCIPLAEYKDAENALSDGKIILSYREPRWPKKVLDSAPHSDFRWKYLPAQEFSAEDHPSDLHAWQFPESEKGSCTLSLLKESPEAFTTFFEGAIDHYLVSSTLHSPLDTFMNCPLLLNHVSEDILDQELYCDDCDNELGYRKML